MPVGIIVQSVPENMTVGIIVQGVPENMTVGIIVQGVPANMTVGILVLGHSVLGYQLYFFVRTPCIGCIEYQLLSKQSNAL